MTSQPIEQRRILRTEIPGPASQILHARKLAAVSAGVSTGLPAYIERGAGGILVDADGNHLIDFGSGIAVTSVGNGAPAGRRGGATTDRRASPTPASWSTLTRSTSRSARSSTS
jgi:acetylornithine/succinyldiaminopimelate/putrescine aminotransferase